MDEQNLKALLLLNRVTNYTPVQKFALLKKFGSAKAAFTEREKAEGFRNRSSRADRPWIRKEDRSRWRRSLIFTCKTG